MAHVEPMISPAKNGGNKRRVNVREVAAGCPVGDGGRPAARVCRGPLANRSALADELQHDLAAMRSVAMLCHEHPLPGA
jgi:hypothetical protein